MIQAITNMFNSAGVLVDQRPSVCRVLARSIFGISSYAQDRKHLVNIKNRKESIISDDVESKLWSWIRNVSWDWKVNTCYWRALGCLIDTRDIVRAAHDHHITQDDLLYLFNQLTTDDINDYIELGRNWRSKPIDEKTIAEVLKKIERYIDNCVYRLRFVWEYDLGRGPDDWKAHFQAEAIQTIYKYEDRKSVNHLINTVKLALNNKLGIMQSRYASVKYGMLVSSDKLDGKNQTKNGKIIKKLAPAEGLDSQPFTNRRAPVTISGEDGSEMDNPELFARCVKPELEIDVRLFIDQVEKHSSSLARYLRLVAAEQEDHEFEQWLDDNNHEIDSMVDLKANAARFCGLARADLQQLRDIAVQDYPIGLQIQKREQKAKAESQRLRDRASRSMMNRKIPVREARR